MSRRSFDSRSVDPASCARVYDALFPARQPHAPCIRGHQKSLERPLDKVPTAHFDSDQFPSAAGLAAWRQMTASLYKTWPRGEPEGFRAEAAGYKVGELVFNQVQFTPARFLRGPELLAAEGRGLLVVAGAAGGRGAPDHGPRSCASAPRAHLPARLGLRLRLRGDGDAPQRHHDPTPSPAAGAGMQECTPVLSWSMAEPDGRLLSMLSQGFSCCRNAMRRNANASRRLASRPSTASSASR